MAEAQKYDLEERTAIFAERIIKFCKSLPLNAVNSPLVNQLVRAGTSIGANYHEANGASSKKDFKNKIFICKKEANETKYWLRILTSAEPSKEESLLTLWKEAQELTLIFSKIAKNTT